MPGVQNGAVSGALWLRGCSLFPFLSNMAKAENTLGTGCIMFLCALRGEWKDSITVSLPANCSDLFWVCR